MPDTGPSVLRKLESGADARVIHLHEAGNLDVEDVQQLNNLIDASDVEGSRLLNIPENNGDLSDTRRAVDIDRNTPGMDSRIIWLEEGSDAAGFQHILNRHAKSDQFYAMSGIDNPNDIENLVMRTVDEGEPTPIPDADDGGTAFELTRQTGDDVTVIVGDNGFIVSARPGKYNR